MKYSFLAFCTFFLIILPPECVIGEDAQWNNTLLPDFRLSIRPILFNNNQGVAGLFEGGRQIFRVNGTYGYAFDDEYFGKVSAEYLQQRLGFAFSSGRGHHWLHQGALGTTVQVPINNYLFDVNLKFSHAPKRNLITKVVPLKNELNHKKIAGSDAFGIGCSTTFSLWETGLFQGAIVYDFVKFHRDYKRDKTVQGLGLKISLDQSLLSYGNVLLNVDIQAPYIAYDALISTDLFLFGFSFDLGIYGQRVHGLQGIPSSSRIGIEIGLDLEKWIHGSVTEKCSFAHWMCTPAVYSPEVLVIRDEKVSKFNDAPEVLALIGDVFPEGGFFTFDVSLYFTGSEPLIFSAQGLPAPLVINPVTGIITGMVNGTLTGSFPVSVKATNYFGAASQIMTLHF